MVIPQCTLLRFAWLLIVLNPSSCIYSITRDTYTNPTHRTLAPSPTLRRQNINLHSPIRRHDLAPHNRAIAPPAAIEDQPPHPRHIPTVDALPLARRLAAHHLRAPDPAHLHAELVVADGARGARGAFARQIRQAGGCVVGLGHVR